MSNVNSLFNLLIRDLHKMNTDDRLFFFEYQQATKLREFRYKELVKELDMLFVGNSATCERVWAPSRDEPMLSKGPVGDDVDL